MKLLHILFAATLAALLAGCDSLVNDLDEDELPRVESKLALSCYISPQSPQIIAKVTESQPLLGPADYQPRLVPNANVVLTDGTAQITLSYDDSLGIYRADSSKFKIRPGQTYTLLVNDSKRSVKAACTVPAKSPSAKFEVDKVPSGFGVDSMLDIRTSWVDIRGEKNYYSIRGYLTIKRRAPILDPVTGTITVKDQNYSNELGFYASNENLFTDTNLDGATFKGPQIVWYLQPPGTYSYMDSKGVLHTYTDQGGISEVQAQILNMDEHYYKFQRSVINAGNNNPFTEPTPVYTNVEGGLGCFGAFNAAILTDKTGW